MLVRRIMSRYVLVKKSSLLIGSLVAAGLVFYHFYKYHHSDLKEDFDQFTDDVADAAKKSSRKAKELVDELKS